MICARLFLVASFAFLSCTAHAARPSLFFTPPVLEIIDEQVRKNPSAMVSQSKHLLHLGSILYHSPDRWTVWIQGEKWTPASTPRANLRIIGVNETAVRLSVALRGDPTTHEVTLQHHQSLNLLTGKIIEGL